LREQGVSLLDVHSRIPSLEDVFVYRIMVREKEVNWQ
jgi:hypothetical protein